MIIQIYVCRCRMKRLLLVPVIASGLLTLSLVLVKDKSSLFRHAFFDSSSVNFDRTPGSYLSGRAPNDSYCNYKYGLPEELLYEEGELGYGPEEGARSAYRVLYNVIERKTERGIPEVTYVTHVTADFVNYLAEVVRYWEGPVSVAAFVPDFDADSTIVQLKQLCKCSPEMSRVAVHFVYPSEHPPYLQNHPQDTESAQNCDLVDSSKISTFRTSIGLRYPINVCRNVARNSAETDYVMVTDVQLIPSEELASRFFRMTESFQIKDDNPSFVFVVPVFEVEQNSPIPRNKKELIKMVVQERAVYFHRHVCSHCQKFPGIKAWVESDPGNVIKHFAFTKREYPFHRWEPVYIGGRNEPLYSEALSWEGLQDKMTQMLEMCLIGYKFVILDGAFLVHWPGIKREKRSSLAKLKKYWRTPYQKENSEKYQAIVKRLSETYEENAKCRLR